MNIAFYAMGNKDWYGGVVHLKAILYALHYSYGASIKKYLIHHPHEALSGEEFRGLIDGRIIIAGPKRGSTLWLVGGMAKRLFSHSLNERRILKKNNIDIVFGPCIQHGLGNIPILSFIWDFQHRHLPEMFSQKECIDREKHFRQSHRVSFRTIVASESIKKDVETFIPRYAHKVRVVRPVTHIPDSIYQTDPQTTLKLYKLPDKFVYLPSQFWKHKNHRVALDALKILNKKGIHLNIVCTGWEKDYRNLAYATDLFSELSRWDSKGQVRHLGLIPYEHVLLLIRQCICVLTPSLFEGFGLTVGEARSLGKRIVLSDIMPHREHKHPDAVYFDPHDAEELAGKLKDIWANTEGGPDKKSEEHAREELPLRIKKSAESFFSVVKEAASGLDENYFCGCKTVEAGSSTCR
jgi:glycosyltransferase involved in cell wall biosynthesis